MPYSPNHCSLRGRTVLIEFRCGRCGAAITEPYAEQQEQAEGSLQHFKPPKGWLDDKVGIPYMMCPDCAKKFVSFIKNEPVSAE